MMVVRCKEEGIGASRVLIMRAYLPLFGVAGAEVTGCKGKANVCGRISLAEILAVHTFSCH